VSKDLLRREPREARAASPPKRRINKKNPKQNRNASSGDAFPGGDSRPELLIGARELVAEGATAGAKLDADGAGTGRSSLEVLGSKSEEGIGLSL
jgi:hypothetical protein